MALASTACRLAPLAAALLCCSGDGGEPTDPCTTPLDLTLGSVVIDGSASTSSPTVSFELEITNPTTNPTRITGYLIDCPYRSAGGSLLRGSGTSEVTIAPGESHTMNVDDCMPGVMNWTGTPTGDDLRCEVEALYSHEGCEGPFPRSAASVTGSDDITLVYP